MFVGPEAVRPLALLVGEADVPLLAYAVAAGVGTGVGWIVLRSLLRPTRRALIPVLIAVVASFVLTCVMLVSLAYQTLFFQRQHLHEVGTAQRRVAPMPDAAVRAIRKSLRRGDTWALTTSDGRCLQDSYRYIWLAFRLYPNRPDCHTPNVELLLGVKPASGEESLASGAGWKVVRP